MATRHLGFGFPPSLRLKQQLTCAGRLRTALFTQSDERETSFRRFGGFLKCRLRAHSSMNFALCGLRNAVRALRTSCFSTSQLWQAVEMCVTSVKSAASGSCAKKRKEGGMQVRSETQVKLNRE